MNTTPIGLDLANLFAIAILGVANLFLLARTLSALLAYTHETQLLREATSSQLRLASLPIIRVELRRKLASDDHVVLIRNVGQQAAWKVVLQGLRISQGNDTWHVSFQPRWLLVPNEEAELLFEIETDSKEIPLEEAHIVRTVFRSWRRNETSYELTLFAEDPLGQCYRSEVTVERIQLEAFWNYVPLLNDRVSFKIGRPIPQTGPCPDKPDLLDRRGPAPVPSA